MPFLDRFRRKKDDPELARRTRLLRSGRISEGTILDIGGESDSGSFTQIFYRYEISGVEYESSQLLDREQQQRHLDYSPGARITVRYDPHQPGNSIVV
ncbi:MAG TPA: DUF3592 domain-containing protein [Pyrinomonadaceae bacterium]|jgi:hypothetical protein